MSSTNEWPMVRLGKVLTPVGVPEKISSPENERFVTVRLHGQGAVERSIGAGKTPKPFTGYRVSEGHFIYSRIDARNGAFALVPAELDGAVVSKDFPIFRIDVEQCFPDYLIHFCRSGSLAQLVQARSMGATNRQRVKEEVFLDFEFPLPPLVEQQRIAEILDQAQSLVNDSVLLEAKSEALLKACFISTFGHPLDPENSTNRQRVGAVSKVVTGNTPPRKDPSNYGSTVEWLKSDNLGGLQPTPAAESLSDVGATKARIVGSGSTLITCIAGSRESIGKSSLLDRTAAFNQQINAIVPGEELDPLFLFAQVKTAPELVRRKATDGMKGIVSKKTLESVKILVPSIDTQRHYSETATEILALKGHTQLRTSELRDLHESLSTRAFAGQL